METWWGNCLGLAVCPPMIRGAEERKSLFIVMIEDILFSDPPGVELPVEISTAIIIEQ